MIESTALSLKQRQYFEAVIAALPHLAEAVAAIPPDCQVKALEAAERSYLRTFRRLGMLGPETWASAVMRRLRRRVREADLTERDKLKRLYEQLSANECLETDPGQGRGFKMHHTASSGAQDNIGREGKLGQLKLYRQLSINEQTGQTRSFDTHDASSSESDADELKLHEQLSAHVQIGQEKNNFEREGAFDKLNLHGQADEQIEQTHNFDTHDTASLEGEFEKLQLCEQLSPGDQAGTADSFDINDGASSGEQKDVGREGAKKAAVALRMTEIWIDVDEIFGGARRAGVENVQMRMREHPKYVSEA